MQPSLNGIVEQMGGMKFDFSKLGKMAQANGQDDDKEQKINPLLIAMGVGFMVSPVTTMAFFGAAMLLKEPLEQQFPGFKKNLEGLTNFFGGHDANVSFGDQPKVDKPAPSMADSPQGAPWPKKVSDAPDPLGGPPEAPAVNKLAHLQSSTTKSLIDMQFNHSDMLGTPADLAPQEPAMSPIQDMQANSFDMMGGSQPAQPEMAPVPMKYGMFNN